MTAPATPRSWRDWSSATKMLVALGCIAGVAVVVFLYV
jgi:hypothetical protein